MNGIVSALGFRGRMLARRFTPLRPRPGTKTILGYHGVTPCEPLPINSRFVSRERLESDLGGLLAASGVRFMPLAEMLEAEPDPAEARFALTFDDGYRGVLHHGLPVLEHLGIPATLFVTAIRSVKADNPMHPADRVDLSAIGEARPFQIDGDEFRLGDDRQWRRSRDGVPLKTILTQCDPSFIEKLEEALPIPVAFAAAHQDYWQLLTPDEIARLGDHPLITIGSHGVSHASIDALPMDAARGELAKSRDWLRQVTGNEINLLCYPHGSYSMATARLAQDLGYRWQIVEQLPDIADPALGLVTRLCNNRYVTSRTQIACFLAGGYAGSGGWS